MSAVLSFKLQRQNLSLMLYFTWTDGMCEILRYIFSLASHQRMRVHELHVGMNYVMKCGTS